MKQDMHVKEHVIDFSEIMKYDKKIEAWKKEFEQYQRNQESND